LVLGHINLDHFLDVASLPSEDRTVPISRQSTELGGTATNIARSAAAWGVRTGIISRVGRDFPAAYWRQIESERIDLSAVEKVAGASSSCCYIVEDRRGGQMTLIHQGPLGDARGAPIPNERLRTTGWLHLTTGDPGFQLRVLAAARAHGVRVSVDPAQEIHYRWDARHFQRLLAGAEILFGNSSEIDHASELLGATSRDGLLAHVPMVVETRGRRGVTAVTRSGAVRVPAIIPRPLRQVTGAGDAFRGGFFAAFFEGQPLRICLIAGTRSAARWMESGAFGPPPARKRPRSAK
jgi:nucleoside kinase